MKKGIVVLLVIGLFVGIAFVMGISSKNKMVSYEESVSSQWAHVQNAYQRRADLIPNLVSTVKGYATHEQKTFTDVTEARAKATDMKLDASQLTGENLQKFQEVQGQLGSALSRLMMVRENYPELKANTNFIALQDELAGTENRISVERNKFNEAVKVYNTYIRSFPQSMFASFFDFQQKPYFEADQAAQKAPTVSFE